MNNKTLKIAMVGLLAALSYIAFTFFQVKVTVAGGTTSFHLGNTFALLGALLVGGVPGGIAASIVMGIGDILDPIYITVAPKTIILKLFIGIVCGFFAHRIIKIKTKEGKNLTMGVVASCTMGMLFNIICEPIFSYFYTSFILGLPEKAAATLAGMNLVTTSVNAVLSIILATIFYLALHKKLSNSGMIEKLLK